MKTLGIGILILFLLIESAPAQDRKISTRNVNVLDEIRQWEDYFNRMPEERRTIKGSGYKQFNRWKWYVMNRLNDDGTFPLGARWNAYVDLLDKSMNSGVQTLNNTEAAANWTTLGPITNSKNTGGRMLDIAFDPNDPDVVWVGAASGGIWKSTDSGVSWSPMSDNIPSLAVSCIVVHNTNSDVIYIGTGETNGNADAVGGAGIFKSTDGGLTWATTGYNTNLSDNWSMVSEMAMDPVYADIVIAATNNGVYRTVDGGVTWTQTLNVTAAKDILFSPTDHNTVYVSVGAHGGNANNGIYKSTDNGVTWTKSITGLPTDWSNTGRISLSISPANSNVLYSYISKSAEKGVYKTTDGGATWSWCSGDPASFGLDYYSWYANTITASLTDPNTVFSGSGRIARSTNAGDSWIDVTSNGNGIHVDIHAIEFHPATGELWVGCDGGIYKSADNGASWIWLNDGLVTMQFYTIGLDPADANYAYGGTQDNGTNQYEGTGTWDHIYGGDGGEVVVDYTDGAIIYAETQNGNHIKSYDRGDSWTSINNGLDGGPWVTPVEIDPVDPLVLYTISNNNIYKTVDGAAKWTLFYDAPANVNTCIKVAPSHNQTIYACGGDNLYKTTDGGVTWSSISSGLPSDGSITYIAVHPNDPQTVYITKSGWTDGRHVYKSTDAGLSWSNITNNLINMPVWCIVIDPYNTNHLYVSHELGIALSRDGGATWEDWSTNLPNVVVDEIEIHQGARLVRAATHGRGMWESPLAHDATEGAPTATTLASNSGRPNTAVLKGRVNAHGAVTTIAFEYGNDDTYGNTVAASIETVSGTADTYVEAVITDLPNGVPVHYRVTATNAYGTAAGNDQVIIPPGRTRSGNCLNLDGTFDPEPRYYEEILINNPSHIPVGDDAYTIEAWIYIDMFDGAGWNGRVGLISWGDNFSSTGGTNAIELTSSGLINVWNGNNLAATIEDISGAWRHVAATYDGTTRCLYLDGALVATDTPAIDHAVPSADNFKIGRTIWYRPFNGRIDEMRIWNIARTQSEIYENMEKPLHGDEANLVAYWPFDEEQGRQVFDKCKNYPTFNDGEMNSNMDETDRLASTAWRNVTMAGETSLVLRAGYDPDNDTITLSSTADPSHGDLTFDNDNVTVTYTPDAGSNDTDTFSFQIDDGVSSEEYTVNVVSGNLPAPASGNALVFDGNDDYMRVKRPVSDDFTIECWISTNQTGPSGSHWWEGNGIVDGEVGGTANDFGISLVADKIAFGVGNPDFTLKSTTSVNDGEWHHVAVTRKRSTRELALYINGVLEATGVGGSSSALTSADFLHVGALQTTARFFSGFVDEVRFWTMVRSVTDIRQSMTQKLSGDETGLAALYQLDHAWGDTVHDYSNHALTGLRVNMDNTDWVTSGADLGDASIVDFSSPTSLTLAHPDGDQFTVNNISGSPDGLAVFCVYDAANVLTPPIGWQELTDGHYFGVRVINGTNPLYDVLYHYEGHSGITNDTGLGMVRRHHNAITSWSATNALQNTGAKTLTLTGQSGTDYITGYQNPIGIDLISFTARYQQDAVLLEWTSLSDAGVAGYFVFRGAAADSGFKRINPTLIRAATDSRNAVSVYSYLDDTANPNELWYKLQSINLDGGASFSEPLSISVNAVKDQPDIPKSFALQQNFPNPFNPETTINFQVPKSGTVRITVFNLRGRKIKTLVDDLKSPGYHSVLWDGSDETGREVGSGMYVVRMESGDFVQNKKVTLLR